MYNHITDKQVSSEVLTDIVHSIGHFQLTCPFATSYILTVPSLLEMASTAPAKQQAKNIAIFKTDYT